MRENWLSKRMGCSPTCTRKKNKIIYKRKNKIIYVACLKWTWHADKTKWNSGMLELNLECVLRGMLKMNVAYVNKTKWIIEPCM